jgi:hypothetical protein
VRQALAMASDGFDPARRGFHAVYRAGEANHCPGCGRTHWLIGRQSAECAFCSTALPLEASMIRQESQARILFRGQPIEPRTRISRDRPRLVGKRGRE